jgi:hypothetical protein
MVSFHSGFKMEKDVLLPGVIRKLDEVNLHSASKIIPKNKMAEF